MLQSIKPTVVYHADWGGKAEKRWCARATLGTDGRHTALTAEPVGTPALLIEKSREVAGETGCVFAGFDFPIGVPASFAERAGISSFRTMLPILEPASGRISIRSATSATRYPHIAPSIPSPTTKERTSKTSLGGPAPNQS